ncbi:cytochrome b5-like heme/steroid binding domain-containing protein [Usnea florida]
MPPPPIPTSTLRAPPTLSTTLRPPPSTASTLRAPPSRSLAPPISSLSTSTLSPSKRPSKKVLLDPGHSPLDWAHLIANPPTTTFLRGADVPAQLIRVPPSALKWHNGRKGRNAWGVWQGKVYNLTPYMKFHPGGVGELMRGAGKVEDGERLFREVHPWVSWENMLGECLVGILVSENEGAGKEGNDLEEMD